MFFSGACVCVCVCVCVCCECLHVCLCSMSVYVRLCVFCECICVCVSVCVLCVHVCVCVWCVLPTRPTADPTWPMGRAPPRPPLTPGLALTAPFSDSPRQQPSHDLSPWLRSMGRVPGPGRPSLLLPRWRSGSAVEPQVPRGGWSRLG